jgi:hypothetical protein
MAGRRINQDPSAARIGITGSMPGGASQDELRSHPGAYMPKSSRAIGPSRNALGYRLAHLLGWKTEACRRGRVGGYLSGLSGERCERDTGATRNRTTEIQPGDKPHRQCRPIEPHTLSVRLAQGRLPVGSGPSRSGRRGNPVVRLNTLHWLFRRASGPMAGRFPRDTAPIHPARECCQESNPFFRAELP